MTDGVALELIAAIQRIGDLLSLVIEDVDATDDYSVQVHNI